MISKRKLDTHAVRFGKKNIKKVSKFTYTITDDEEIKNNTQEEPTTLENATSQENPIHEEKNSTSANTKTLTTDKKDTQDVQKKYAGITPRSKVYKQGRKRFQVKSLAFLACCLLIGRARGGMFSFMKSIVGNIGSSIGNTARLVVGNAIGTKPQTDESGNINIAILGYGGEAHAGGYLTDAIIIASLNMKDHTMSMLSLPRDLRVKKPTGTYGKLNSVFQDGFFTNKKDYEKAAPAILNKLTEITNIPLHYYAFIDFHGFEQFIDSLGGIKINVPEPIYDSQYPGENNSYIVFSIDSGEQILDGATALKYARSRHSTSDYSRSMRQQLIIDGVIDKLVSAKMILSPSKIEDAYKNVTKFVHTNATLDEVLWLLPFAKSIDHKSSRQVAVCGSKRRELAQPGCLLYTPPMEAMGGASTQIPVGATPGNPSDYSVIHSYVQDIVLNTSALAEKATIRVLNGLSTGVNKSIGNVTLANNIAVDFVKEGFTIFDIGNTTGGYTQTTVITNGKGREVSLEKIKRQLPPFQIQEGAIVPDGPSLTVILGDDMVTNGKIYPGSPNIPLYLKY